MKVERDSDTKYRGKRNWEKTVRQKKLPLMPHFSLLPAFKVTGVLHTISTALQEMSEHQGASLSAWMHIWSVGKYTSALRRRASRGVDHGVN